MLRFNIFSWFKKTKPQDITFHPKLNLAIKYAFKCGGKHYYQLLNDYEMPKKRFAFARTFYSEMQSKVTSQTLEEFCIAIKTQINAGKPGEAYKLVDELQWRTTWLFDPDTLYRFASVVYFTLDENLQDYDMKFNEAKQETFKKKELLTFFLQLLMNGQKLLSTLSGEDLKNYLTRLLERKEQQLKLISELKVSGDSIKKTG